MTTRTLPLFSACLLLGALMSACGGATDAAGNTSGDKVGVPECDEFILKYEACVDSKVPQTSRSVTKANLDLMRAAWRKSAERPEGKADLARGCKQALEQAKTTMGNYGCSW